MDNLETSLSTTVDNYRGNASEDIVERFIKPRASAMFGHPAYFPDGPGPYIEVSGPHENVFNSGFGIWIGGKHFSNGCCRSGRMHKLWRALGLR